jgi:hypothetical protein
VDIAAGDAVAANDDRPTSRWRAAATADITLSYCRNRR